MKRFRLLVALLSLLFTNTFSFSQETPNPYDKFEPFKSRDNKWGYRVQKATMIQAQYEYVTHFSEGLALVKSKGKWGYIDTLGNWFITPQFDKGQPIQNRIAFVQNGDKIGLLMLEMGISETPTIDENGYEIYTESYTGWKFLLEPIYDNIRQDYSSYFLEKNGKKGYFNIEVPEQVIEAKYDSISVYYYDLVSALKDNGKWDLYTNGSLALEDIDKNITSGEYIYEAKSLILSKNGKKGVFSSEKQWLVKPEYAFIEQLNFPNYSINGSNYNSIFALHDMDPMAIDPELLGTVNNPDKVYFAKLNGKKILDQPVTAVVQSYDPYSELPSIFALECMRGNEMLYVFSDFRVLEVKFSKLTSLCMGQFFIGQRNGQSFILDNNLTIIDSFMLVTPYSDMTYNDFQYDEYGEPVINFDPETGEPIYESQLVETPAIYEPFVLVYKKEGDKEKKAVYDMIRRKVVSTWFEKTDNLIVRRYNASNQLFDGTIFPIMLYTYHIEGEVNSKMGFYSTGMEKGSELMFEANQNPIVFNRYFVLDKFDGDKKIQYFYSTENDKTTLLFTDCEVFTPNEVLVSNNDSYGYYGDNGEYYPSEGDGDLQVYGPFLILKRNKVYGAVCTNSKIIAPQFDSVYCNGPQTVMIAIKGAKYSYITLTSGQVFTPDFDYPLSFDASFYAINQTVYYTEIYNQYDGTENYFLTSYGKKFYSMENSFSKKVGKYFGVYTYPNYYAEEKNQVKAQYKDLYAAPTSGMYFAKGKNKKYGVISLIGDTVIPFKYSKILAQPGSGDGFYNFKVFNKSKCGLYRIDAGEVVPPIYDSINPIGYLMDIYSTDLLVTLKGKKGMIDQFGKMKIKPEYDQITATYAVEGSGLYLCKKGNKTAVYPSYALDFGPYTRLYDEVYGMQGFIKTGELYESYDLISGKLLSTNKEIELSADGFNYKIIKRNGKFAAFSLDDKQLTEFIYDDATMYGADMMTGYENGIFYFINVFTGERYTQDQW